jgi:hypothetical protein
MAQQWQSHAKIWVDWMDEQTILPDSTASTRNLNSLFEVEPVEAGRIWNGLCGDKMW